MPSATLRDHPIAPMAAHAGSYYIRLMVLDQPGVLADISAVLRDHEVSIESLIQRGRNPGQAVPIVLTSHDTTEARMSGALAAHRGPARSHRAATDDPYRTVLREDA